jgi:hypothetical protein
MIEISKKIFETIVPAAAASGTQVFEALQGEIVAAQEYLQDEILGPVELCEEMENKGKMVRFICFRAFERAIPQMDLVLTATGFGVVSNQNVSPASKERVEKLLSNIRRQASDALDAIIMSLLGNKEWASGNQAVNCVNHVVFTGSELRRIAGIEMLTREDLFSYESKMIEAEQLIKDTISEAQFNLVLQHIREGNLSADESGLLVASRNVIAMDIADNRRMIERNLAYISELVEGNLELFSLYAESKEYERKHFMDYENKYDDSTYFFG